MNAPNHILQTLLTNCTKLAIIVCFLFGLSFVHAQTAGLSYQAVIYNNENEAVASQSARLKFTILDSSNGTLTFTYDDGTSFTTSNLTTAKTISDDMIFDGDDDSSSVNDNYYYVSMVVNNNWRVIRYDKANINLEKEATVSNNSGQTTQPTSLGVCTGLNYE